MDFKQSRLLGTGAAFALRANVARGLGWALAPSPRRPGFVCHGWSLGLACRRLAGRATRLFGASLPGGNASGIISPRALHHGGELFGTRLLRGRPTLPGAMFRRGARGLAHGFEDPCDNIGPLIDGGLSENSERGPPPRTAFVASVAADILKPRLFSSSAVRSRWSQASAGD